jgi:hypothetical protein
MNTMKTSIDYLANCGNEPSAGIVSASSLKRRYPAWLKLLFAATAAITIVLSYQVAREAVGLHRVLFDYEDRMETIARMSIRADVTELAITVANANQ